MISLIFAMRQSVWENLDAVDPPAKCDERYM
jgi:hypothetical protein